MANVLTSGMLSPKMQGPTSAPQSRSDGKELLPLSSSPPSLEKLSTDDKEQKLSDIRTEAIKLLLSSPDGDSTAVKRFYSTQTGTALAPGPAGNIVGLNFLSVGGNDNNRIGNFVRNRRLYIRGTLTMDAGTPSDSTSTGANTYLSQAPVVRILLVRDNFPPIGAPVFVDAKDFEPIPQSTSGIMTCIDRSSYSTVYAHNNTPAAIRNPVTIKRYHVVRDETVTVGKQFAMTTDSRGTGTIYINYAGQHHFDFHHELNDETVFTDNDSLDYMTNRWFLCFATDWGFGGSPPNPSNGITLSMTSQLLFEDSG